MYQQVVPSSITVVQLLLGKANQAQYLAYRMCADLSTLTEAAAALEEGRLSPKEAQLGNSGEEGAVKRPGFSQGLISPARVPTSQRMLAGTVFNLLPARLPRPSVVH